jgi:hypothetical protein
MKGTLCCTCCVLKVTPMCMYWLSFLVWKIATVPHALTSTSITTEKEGMCYHLLFYPTVCWQNWWYIRFPYCGLIWDLRFSQQYHGRIRSPVWWCVTGQVVLMFQSRYVCSCCLTLKVKEATCFKTSGTICPTTHCHISEDLNLQGMQWLELHHEGKLCYSWHHSVTHAGVLSLGPSMLEC